MRRSLESFAAAQGFTSVGDYAKADTVGKRNLRLESLRRRSRALAQDAQRAALRGEYACAAHLAWRSAETLIKIRDVLAEVPSHETWRKIHRLRVAHARRCAANGWYTVHGRYVPTGEVQ